VSAYILDRIECGIAAAGEDAKDGINAGAPDCTMGIRLPGIAHS
jgi:hypothetical protein